MPFDTWRLISIGTARDSDIVRQMTAAEAITFVRSAESKRAVDDALKWSARLQMELLTLVKEFRTKSRFDFDNTVRLQHLWRNQRKDVAQQLTNVLKELGDRQAQGRHREADERLDERSTDWERASRCWSGYQMTPP
jgi:hypothetical protein